MEREMFGLLLEMGARHKLYQSAIRARALLKLAQGSAPRR
jgi:hypothetical protein